PASGPASSEPKAEWQVEWDRLATASKQEGKLVLNIVGGVNYEKALAVFERRFPGVTVEQTTFASSSLFAPRVISEMKAGVYTWDISQIMTTTGLGTLLPAGAWDPIRPALFHPEVVGDQNWESGFEAGFPDNDRKWCYAFTRNSQRPFVINTDLVNESELKSVKDLLNPKWQGKMIAADPRTLGPGFWLATILRLRMGDDILKQLYVDQKPVISRDTKQLADWVVRSQYPIHIGSMGPGTLDEYRAQGLGKNVKEIELPEASHVSAQTVFLNRQAPHPNAAKLFLNWLLGKEGQTAWAQVAVGANSRRKDVPPTEPASVPVAGREYVEIYKESVLPKITETQELMKKLLQ
ncbi:MAG: extracellular solute-binding protein, partial [Chloroflexota bacterium]